MAACGLLSMRETFQEWNVGAVSDDALQQHLLQHGMLHR